MCFAKECSLGKEDRAIIEALLAKSREKLAVAEKLLAESAFYDDVTSRAYFAAYRAAQALLKAEGLEADSHRGVATLFGLQFAKTEKVPPKLGRYLNSLKDDRESGDYDVYSGIDRGAAEDAVREAREFLAEAERYLAPYLSGAG
jgi:uncharacterized protein (UPF0332 family)